LVGDFEPEVIARVLGSKPDPWPGFFTNRAEDANEWPSDWPGREYLHRAVARLLWENGGTAGAADAIRRGLEHGDIRAVAIDDEDGKPYPIPMERWRAPKGREELYWTGRAPVADTEYRGDIYLLPVDEFSAVLVPPTPAQTLACEAERQVETAGVTDPKPAPQPANTKPAELGTRERTTVCKMLLAAMVDAYGIEPGKRSDAASQIAATSERLWPGNGVSERTVRNWHKAAVEELGDPTAEMP
jgi:hypothetical protein